MDKEIEKSKIVPVKTPISPLIPPRDSYARVPKNWVTDLEISESMTGFHQGPRGGRRGAKLILWSWAAALIDSGLIVGLGLIFLASFLLVVQSQWGAITSHKNEFLFTAGLAIFVTLSFFYMVVLRSFLGFTLGEWACGLRLGSPRQRSQKEYVLRVLLRASLLLVTGIIVLPVVSLLMRQDLPGKISGLSLFSLR